MRAFVEERKQKIVGKWPKSGPDIYVAVQIVPDGVKPLRCLNLSNARKRGIKIVYFGNGYSTRQQTERSMLNIARKEAKEFAEKVNKGK